MGLMKENKNPARANLQSALFNMEFVISLTGKLVF